MTNNVVTTIVHFYTSRTGAVDTYSWFLEDSNGETLKQSLARYSTKKGVIENATKSLGEDFWTKHTVIQDDWFNLLNLPESVGYDPKSAIDRENEHDAILMKTVEHHRADSYLFVSHQAPYTWRLRNRKGRLMMRSAGEYVTRRGVIDNINYVFEKGPTLESIFVVQSDWRNLVRADIHMNPMAKPTKEKTIISEQGSTTSELKVELSDQMGSDTSVCRAARVSTLGGKAPDSHESIGLIHFLMKNRHGSPFEHGAFTFRITAPIFVWREFMRHRIGFSYNEESGRYKELEALAYVPARDRNLVQVGKPGAYSFEPGTDEQFELVIEQLGKAYDAAWSAYHVMLDAGIAKEVARVCLPVATYSTAYVTCNPRSMMSFLSLRTKHEDSTFPSYPQHEINMVANEMETYFAELYPITHAAFVANGRVAP